MEKFKRLITAMPWFFGGLLAACSQQQVKPEKPLHVQETQVIIDLRENPGTRLKQRGFGENGAKSAGPKVQNDDLWQHLFSLYRIPPVAHPRIDRELQWYESHPEYIQRVQARARPYLHTIVSEIEKSGLPGELALLPVVESAFKPRAYSSQRAAGLWQFIPSTGRLYGLKQDWWVDLRRDVHASTRAAIRYLKKLNTDFHGDWLLALAAYNAGEGAVQRAIRRNRRLHRPTDFWHLRLPRETRAYVPKLLAVARLFANAPKYGIFLEPLPNRPLYTQVEIDSQLDLTLAAKLAELPLEELIRLNPGFRRWATAPEGPHRIVLPLEKVELFEERLAKLPATERVRWHRHLVRKGDTLGHIARRYGTPVAVIRKTNRLRGSMIFPGQALMIPIASHKQQFKTTLVGLRGYESVRTGGVKIHIVRRGDSLWGIARRYGVKVGHLLRWNHFLHGGKSLRPGQKLRIHQATLQEGSDPFHPVVYTVRKGDSLYRIARRFGISMRDLRQWNRDRIRGTLKPGQRLKVYVKKISS